MEVGSTPSLMLLAEVASVLPWETSRADVPFADRKAFADAMTPEYFLELLAALQEAMQAVETFHGPVAWGIYCDNAPEWKRWNAVLSKALGQSGGTK